MKRNSRLTLILKYWRNKRLCEYQSILETAVNHSYQCISLRDYAERNYDTTKKLFILRHDVDHVSKASRLMFDIEIAVGARSSFYFRNCTLDEIFMKEIEREGSEASLHFETLADYMKTNGITEKNVLLSSDFKQDCLRDLKLNLEHLRETMNLPFVTIASHGEKINSTVGIPNNYLTEDIEVYPELGIKLEAYNCDFLSSIPCYISDTVQEYNLGYRYGKHPLVAISEGHDRILFLTHPNHWYYTPCQRLKKTLKLLIYKPVIQNEKFVRLA